MTFSADEGGFGHFLQDWRLWLGERGRIGELILPTICVNVESDLAVDPLESESGHASLDMSHEVGLLKWITCVVASGRERQFATAQSKWSVISSAPGLVGQFGGWDAKRAGIALIASLWGDRDSYTHFMNEIHDAVTDSNRQSGTYSDIAVEFFRPILSMPGQYQDLVTSVPHGKFLRAADCRVKEERTQHFLEVQTAVWIPAMSRSRGMLGGDFHVDEADESHFLVVTLWDSEENHEKYSRESVPKLRRQADVSKDLVGLIGSAVALENAWKVMGVTPK